MWSPDAQRLLLEMTQGLGDGNKKITIGVLSFTDLGFQWLDIQQLGDFTGASEYWSADSQSVFMLVWANVGKERNQYLIWYGINDGIRDQMRLDPSLEIYGIDPLGNTGKILYVNKEGSFVVYDPKTQSFEQVRFQGFDELKVIFVIPDAR
jgi:hypothetical protein